MIGERHVLQPMARDILVEGRPAAVAALEAQLPVKRALEDLRQLRLFVRPDQPQRHQHHRGVVRVRVKNVVVFEGPAARFRMRVVDRPIATDAHLLVDQPLRRSLQRGMLRREAGLGQCDNIDRRIPDRGKTRLNAEILRVVDKKARKSASAF